MTTPAPALLEVKVTPGAPRNAIDGWMGGVLKVRLQAPPVEGKANAALVAFLASVMGVPRGAISIRTGDTSRLKRVAVAGMDAAAIRARLEACDRA